MIIGFLDRYGYAYDRELRKIVKRILDDSGGLILEYDEQVIKEGEYKTEISTKWGNWLTTPIFKNGVGNLIKTNKRLIFIRQPTMFRGFKEFHPFNAHITIPDMWEAKKLNEIGAKEFFEFNIEEFVLFKKPSILCFYKNREKFQLWIGPYKEPISNFLGDLVNINRVHEYENYSEEDRENIETNEYPKEEYVEWEDSE